MSAPSEEDSSSNDRSSCCSDSLAAPTFSDFSSDTSLDLDSFLGPQYQPPNPQFPTYRLVGDNIDKEVKPRNMTMEHQTRSLHYFHTYAVKDRIDLSAFSDDVPTTNLDDMDLEKLLPSHHDEHMMTQNFTTLIGRCLVKNIPFFKKFDTGIQKHIYHEYSEAMSAKSEVVRTKLYYLLLSLNLATYLSLGSSWDYSEK